MIEKDFVKQLGADYAKVLADARRYDYDVNEEQFNKLNNIVIAIQKYIKTFEGEITSLDLNPTEIHGGVTATFPNIYMWGDFVAVFADAIREASAITIDATSDTEICLSITVPNVFKRITDNN